MVHLCEFLHSHHNIQLHSVMSKMFNLIHMITCFKVLIDLIFLDICCCWTGIWTNRSHRGQPFWGSKSWLASQSEQIYRGNHLTFSYCWGNVKNYFSVYSIKLWTLLLLPSVFPSIKVFSSESALCMRWPKYWSFSFNISPSNEYSRLVSFKMD